MQLRQYFVKITGQTNTGNSQLWTTAFTVEGLLMGSMVFEASTPGFGYFLQNYVKEEMTRNCDLFIKLNK